MAEVQVTVLHNYALERFLRPEPAYEEGDWLRRVFDARVESDADPAAALEVAYALTNSRPDELLVAARYRDQVAAYRAAGLRSTSVGDVLVVGEAAYAVDPFGFAHLDRPPAWRDATPGAAEGAVR